MSFLYTLPDVLFATVLSSWLTAANVARLDSALCNKESRDAILNIAYRHTTVLRIPPLRFPIPRSTMIGMIMWVLTKQAAVTDLFLTKHVSTQQEVLFENYLAVRGSSLERITLYCGSSERIAEYVAKSCPNLRGYYAEETHGDHALVMLAQNCPRLQEVRLSGKYTDATINDLARSCHGLRTVRLEPYSSLSEQALAELIKNCPGLVCFRIGLSSRGELALSDTFVVQLTVGCPCIEEVELLGTHITEVGMNALAERSLTLRQLSLSDGSVSLDGTRSAPPLHALTHLHLFEVSLSDSDLRALLSRCPNLQFLGLASLPDLTEAGLVEAVAQLPPLHTLYLGHSAGDIITDVVLEIFARRCAGLRNITLHCLSYVTDNGVCALVRYCPQLESIDLDGMETTDAVLDALTSFCDNLLSARFSICYISSVGVQAFIEGCPHLVHLTVEECDRVGKVAMRKVAKFRPFEESGPY